MKKRVFWDSWVVTGFLAAVIVCIILYLYCAEYEPFLFIYSAF
ncbi:MAG: hypothetical protein PHH68_07770 [Candidatus Omnitrophica bacterium]|nr:hypothetical protein [Candidatus Omnitrophota bacterium]